MLFEICQSGKPKPASNNYSVHLNGDMDQVPQMLNYDLHSSATSAMKKLLLLFLSSVGMLISTSQHAYAQALSKVSNCSGVYEFYGAPQPGIGVGILYYISPTKNALMACFKGSRMGGATPLQEYLNSSDISSEDKKAIAGAAKKLGFSAPYIHSLGL